MILSDRRLKRQTETDQFTLSTPGRFSNRSVPTPYLFESTATSLVIQVVFLKSIMQLRVLLLISCMQVLFCSVTLFKLATDTEEAIRSLNSRLLRSTGLASPANPSIHIALRLSTVHSLVDERNYLRKLKTDLQNKLTSSPGTHQESAPSTGLVALYLLALRASCQDLSSRVSALLYLKKKLREERKHTNYPVVPLTNHYQYSLGVLALCVNNVRIDHSVLRELNPREHHGHPFVDTAAMVVLALKCVNESKVPNSSEWMYSKNRRTEAQTAVNKLMRQIRRGQNDNMWNIYSTSVALQALLAVGEMERWSEGQKKLLHAAQGGAFDNPMALSQLLPVLYQKTYLDIGKMDCNNETDGLKWSGSGRVPIDQGTEPKSNQQASYVHLAVKYINDTLIYTTKVPLRDRMSLLDVLKEAKKNDLNFNFETKTTLWGPFLTSVNHIMAQDSMSTYWRLITGQKTTLEQGIRDYRPVPGEHILLQLVRR
ncbi:transcobalamin-2-like isoform X2 [Heptranchias perlo]|uniref:transcobalamin-2-like isoform X2 n=1 Tax=Heptranchias perlo TaxID=212740 RepID=UPI00355AAF92